MNHDDILRSILDLGIELIRIPSITVGTQPRMQEVWRAATTVAQFLERSGLEIRRFEQGPYPAILAGFPGALTERVLLSGHFDVVAPEPDDSQFEPRIEGDYLTGRGSADMKVVVATFMAWMKERLAAGPPFPPISLLLIGNEEVGEDAPMGTAHVLELLGRERDYSPSLLVAGERTGESGNELWGGICNENRGVVRFKIEARGAKGHSGLADGGVDLVEQMLHHRFEISQMFERYFNTGIDGWQSQLRFPFFHVGEPGIYNVTAERGVLGVEIRPIPQDNLAGFQDALNAYSEQFQLPIDELVVDPGIQCDLQEPHLQALLDAVTEVSGHAPDICRKLAGTSARFAPEGRGVIWGQSGIGPHTGHERHFIPSIMPYYRALDAFGERARSLRT